MEQPFNYFTGKILCNEPLWLGVGGHNASLKKMVSLQYQDISTRDGGRGVPKSTHDATETDHADQNETHD
jgi:hypothetical protein